MRRQFLSRHHYRYIHRHIHRNLPRHNPYIRQIHKHRPKKAYEKTVLFNFCGACENELTSHGYIHICKKLGQRIKYNLGFGFSLFKVWLFFYFIWKNVLIPKGFCTEKQNNFILRRQIKIYSTVVAS